MKGKENKMNSSRMNQFDDNGKPSKKRGGKSLDQGNGKPSKKRGRKSLGQSMRVSHSRLFVLCNGKPSKKAKGRKSLCQGKEKSMDSRRRMHEYDDSILKSIRENWNYYEEMRSFVTHFDNHGKCCCESRVEDKFVDDIWDADVDDPGIVYYDTNDERVRPLARRPRGVVQQHAHM